MDERARHVRHDSVSRGKFIGDRDHEYNTDLVVEDERLVAKALQNELEQFGYSVSGIASSASEAVTQVEEHRPDLVLMDIHLKGEADGIEAAERIQSRSGVPVIYLSAFSDAQTVARASETNAFGYLIKPYEERELQTTIEMALAKHRAEERLEESRRWLAAIHNGIDDAVVATDPENNVHSINFAGERLTGWPMEDAIGVPVMVVCNLLDESGRIVQEDFADRVVCESRAIELPDTTRLVSRDGRETPVEGSVSPIFDSRGEFLGDGHGAAKHCGAAGARTIAAADRRASAAGAEDCNRWAGWRAAFRTGSTTC